MRQLGHLNWCDIKLNQIKPNLKINGLYDVNKIFEIILTNIILHKKWLDY